MELRGAFGAVSAWGRGAPPCRDTMVGFDWRISPVGYPCKLHRGDMTSTSADTVSLEQQAYPGGHFDPRVQIYFKFASHSPLWT